MSLDASMTALENHCSNGWENHLTQGLSVSCIVQQTILDNMPQGVFWKDINAVYLGCNQHWARVTGLSNPEQIIGKTDRELPWIAEEVESYHDRDRQVMESGQPELHVLTTRRKITGEQLWFDASRVPLRDQSGAVIGLLCTFEDITERKQAADKLNKSAELLQLVLDNIPQAIFWKDRDSVYLGCNRNWAQAAGVKMEDVIGKTDAELVWSEEAQLYCEQDRQVMATGTPVLHLIEQRVHADGSQVWIDVNKIPIRDADGNVIGILGTIEDITDRKQAEVAVQESEARFRQKATQLEKTLGELRQTQAQLVQTEKMSSLGQLVAGIAHEINNPVNFIYGNLNHANDYIADLLNLVQLYQQHHPNPALEVQNEIEEIDLSFVMEDLPKLFNSMKVGADRIQQIVLSLRNFSRMDEAEVKAVNLHDGIESTLLILQSRLKAKNDFPAVEVVKEYAELPLVECFAGQLNQVFMNILANAIDALEGAFVMGHSSSPTIWIRTESVNRDLVAIRIRDNGPGMTERVYKHLFDPFFTTKPVGRGTGLGLSISYQIVTERHRGTLTCHSTLGMGSEFVIEIPTHQPESAR